MKILKLVIKDPYNNIVRETKFELTGVNYIYGNITKPLDSTSTINSLGKSVFLKLVDFILGGAEKSEEIKEGIKEYSIESIVLFEDKEYFIRRKLSENKTFVNGKEMSTDEYKEYFGINRELVKKQIVIKPKLDLLSTYRGSNRKDYLMFLELIKLKGLEEISKRIYDVQSHISELETSKTKALDVLGSDSASFESENFKNNKELEELQNKIKELDEKIKTLEISNELDVLQKTYNELKVETQTISSEIYFKNMEITQNQKYIDENRNNKISSEEIVKIFKKSKIQVPEMVIRNLQEADKFYKTVVSGRVVQMENDNTNLKKQVSSLEIEQKHLKEEMDRIAKILSNNEVYQDAVEIITRYNVQLQSVKFKEGSFSSVLKFNESISTHKTDLLELFTRLNADSKNYTILIEKYKKLVYTLVFQLYGEREVATFEIKPREYHLKNGPMQVSFVIQGEGTDGGIKRMKNNIIDYLMYEANTVFDFFVHDSSNYDSVDPRQTTKALIYLEESAIRLNKQVIVAINKYQIYESLHNSIIDRAKLTLNEGDKLFGFNY